ncbi:MAG: hypothetical protein L3K18_09545 [Thermoplasmata archaeon]|nr:hypothetical protein [Thermoplasmata archaeon]
MAHLSLSPQMVTGLATLIVGILTYVAANASQIVEPQYSALVAFIAAAVAAFIAHSYDTNSTPTSNSGAPSTVAGPPASP